MGLLWKGTLQKTEIKMPRSREKTVPPLALLTPKSKRNPEGRRHLKLPKLVTVI